MTSANIVCIYQKRFFIKNTFALPRQFSYICSMHSYRSFFATVISVNFLLL